MCRCLLAAVAAVLVVLSVGRAPDARADALADARKAVDASDYPTARTALVTALKAGNHGPDELADIYKMTGIVEGALGSEKTAGAAFAKWLALEPKASLPQGTSPKIMRPFTAAADQAKKRGAIEAKAETEDDPPAITLVVVNDPEKMIVGAKVYYKVDKGAEQTLAADGEDRIKIDLGTGKRLDVRLHALDEYGNRVVELGSKDVPLVITSSGTTKQIVVDPKDADLLKKKKREPDAPRAWYAQWWVWGIATGVTTAVGGYFAWRTYDEVQHIDTLNANSLAHRWSEAQAIEDDARRDLLITNITLSVAGAFALGTALLYFTRPDTETETRAAVTPIPGGGAVVLGGHF